MKSKQLYFFTTHNDIKPVIEDIEKLLKVTYYLTGLLDTKTIPSYHSLLDTPDVGHISAGDWNKADDYIILPDNLSLNIEDIPQKKGGIKYSISQLYNKKSNVIKIGGIYTESPNVLVAGRVGTISDEDFSLKLFKIFSSSIRKHFKTKVDGFYLGPEALNFLKEGWRLVLDEGRSKEYDLKLP